MPELSQPWSCWCCCFRPSRRGWPCSSQARFERGNENWLPPSSQELALLLSTFVGNNGHTRLRPLDPMGFMSLWSDVSRNGRRKACFALVSHCLHVHQNMETMSCHTQTTPHRADTLTRTYLPKPLHTRGSALLDASLEMDLFFSNPRVHSGQVLLIAAFALLMRRVSYHSAVPCVVLFTCSLLPWNHFACAVSAKRANTAAGKRGRPLPPSSGSER
jgi:hypothetical protein